MFKKIVSIGLIVTASLMVVSSEAGNSAPPLTYLQVYAVYSERYPKGEIVRTWQDVTALNHGGAWIRIKTKELGIGWRPVAKMNTYQLKLYSEEIIDTNHDKIVDGYYRVWEYRPGFECGQFTYQNTSTNYPNNTLSDYIYVQ